MIAAELERLIEDAISKTGVHLIDLVVRGEGKGRAVEVFIDSEEGITTEICSDVSREVDRLISSSGLVRGSYFLTVSSPGISRPLKYPWQYRKHIGRQLEMTVRSNEGVRKITGTFVSMEENGLVVKFGNGESQESIALSAIVEARVKMPW